MSYETIDYRKVEEIGFVTLNRPENANTFSSGLVRDLHAVVDQIEADPTVRVVVFTGAGRIFCAGADLKEKDRSANWINSLRALFTRIEKLDRPTIAAINGAAMGGGCEIAISCDLRVMSEEAIIGVPEIKFGALAIAGGTQRLPRVIGMGKAKEMHFTGDPITAQEAHRIGLVNRVVPREKVLDEARALAKTLIDRSPRALAMVKYLINVGSQMDLRNALDMEAEVSKYLSVGSDSADFRKKAAELYPVYKGIFAES